MRALTALFENSISIILNRDSQNKFYEGAIWNNEQELKNLSETFKLNESLGV